MTNRPRLHSTNAGLGFRSPTFARWLSLFGLTVAAGCSGFSSRIGGLAQHDGSQGVPDAHAPITSAAELDLLFMIDNSSSMAPLQAKLTQRLGDFMNILKLLPGGLPSVHIAVVSSSLGAGRFGNVPGCAEGTIGNGGGAFRRPDECRMIMAGQSFISADRGVNNFSGDITDAFSCITQVGDTGCGFEQQFASTIAALQKASNSADPDNAGFLRKNAFLGIVMLTNEDDCSTPLDFSSDLFNPSVATVADPSGLGGLQSYRCNEFGHLCNGAPPPHQSPASGAAVTLTGCTSSEGMSPGPGGSAPDPVHQLITVSEFVSFLKGLKDDPSRIFVAALAGAPSPYIVGGNAFQLGSGGTDVQPMIQHSCSSVAGDYADPAVRVAEFVRAFGPNGVFETICADDFKPAMVTIGNAMVGMMAP